MQLLWLCFSHQQYKEVRLNYWTVKACSPTLEEWPSEALVQVLTEEMPVMASLLMPPPSGLEGLLLLQLCVAHRTCTRAHMHTSMYTRTHVTDRHKCTHM